MRSLSRASTMYGLGENLEYSSRSLSAALTLAAAVA